MRKQVPMLFNSDMVQTIQNDNKKMTRRIIKGVDPVWPLEWVEEDAPISKTDRYGNEHYKELPGFWATFEAADHYVEHPMFKAPCKSGDILYVRETWTAMYDPATGHTDYFYAAIQKDFDTISATSFCDDDGFDTGKPFPWKPSIHMPKHIARLFLKVTDVRAERLQDITDEDAIREGIKSFWLGMGESGYASASDAAAGKYFDTPVGAYASLWNSLYTAPQPVREHGEIVRYESYPWQDIQEVREYKGLPWHVIGNPWVWAISFDRTSKEEVEKIMEE